MSVLLSAGLKLTERGLVPDGWVRRAIRSLLRTRLEEAAAGPDVASFAAAMREGPVAPVPEKANEQHYELPAEFFELVLGPHRKYSGCLWEDGTESLGEAEAAALETTVRRAGIADGMDVLELGCGWGSLTLWMAERFPGCRLTAVSNSTPQREYIEARAAERRLGNVRVLTADMNAFTAPAEYDRVVSVEMFEHMRNWGELLTRISGWLRPGGRLFLHVFAHRRHAYRFETKGAGNWMGRHFFTGGIMPAERLVDEFAERFEVERRWWWDGTHYARTSEAWLSNLDARRAEVLPIFAEVYGKADAGRWLRRWRLFFLACAELFAFDGGREWGVAHALLGPHD